jgi:Calcium-dependent channel, 7TM region, putative phosphate
MVHFVYSCIAPLTCFFLVFCFGVCETGYRYHFIHNIKPEPDSGGKLWRYFIQVSMASLLIAEMTLL